MRKWFVLSLVLTSLLFGSIVQANTDALQGYYNLEDYVQKTGTLITGFKESPLLQGKDLPPVEERLPKNPLVHVPWEEAGQYGGTLRWSSHSISPDLEMRHINHVSLLEQPPSEGQDRYNGLYGMEVQPGIFERWERDETGTVFTFTIREGLRWSDGVFVSTEDVRYTIEDVYWNEDVTPVLGEHLIWLEWEGIPTKFEYLDERTFRMTFGEPYGAFVDEVVCMGGWSTFLRPSHYMKQFHRDYTDWDQILPLMQAGEFESKDDWGRYYLNLDSNWGSDSWVRKEDAVECPTLHPWVTVRVSDDGDWQLERNPYFYMIDPLGNQLPYIDTIYRRYVSNAELVNMDIIAGKTDIQFQIPPLDDYPLFVRNKDKGGYEVMPLKGWQHQMLVYFFNLATQDEVLRGMFQDVRFRQAMSLALDREQIKEALFLGFGRPAQVAPHPGNPFYEEGMEEAFAQYDPARAKQLLDEMGVVDTSGDGWRNRLDGKDFVLQLDYFDVTPPADQGAEMAKRYWEDIGIRVNMRKWDVGYFWEKHLANQLESTLWWYGGDELSWFRFGLMTGWRAWFYNETEQAVEPLAWAKDLFQLMMQISSTPDDAERIELGKELHRIQAEQVPYIGTVVDTPLPFVYNKDLGNISVALEKGYSTVTVGEAATQWFYK